MIIYLSVVSEDDGVQWGGEGVWILGMEFNQFIWELYKSSEEGIAAISKDISEYIESDDLFTAQCIYCELDEDEELIIERGSREINLRQRMKEYGLEFNITSLELAEGLFTQIADIGIDWPLDDKDNHFVMFGGGEGENPFLYEDIYDFITGLSAGLYDAHPEFFVPYFFAKRFDEFEKICEAFSISIPEIPGKLKKRERALYYIGINRSLYNFRKQHNLSSKELVAFLYDFAPKSIFSHPKTEILPSAARVWFVIGGVGENGDFDYLDSVNDSSRSFWQGNLETRRGDIILMWCASPRSYLHSVWRAVDDGFNDPFFHYYSTIRIGNPIRIPPISFSEFAQHPLLGQRPAVRARFQGRSGTAFSIEDYQIILEILQKKGVDLSILPEPPESNFITDIHLEKERDVEQKLLEPFLHHLGFVDDDWIRQFPLKMGRGIRYYPDYVLGGDPTPGNESGFAVIECKLSIESKKEMKDAFIQAKSYALRLQTNILMLASNRGLWIFQRRKDGFSEEHFLFKTWKELAHPDVLHQISLIVGKRKMQSSIK